MKVLFGLIFLLLTTSASANLLGNVQTFSPNPDSLFFENVHSSKTLSKNRFNLGLYTSYVHNELSVYDDLTTQNFNNYKDKAWTLDFVAAWGITNHLEIFYSLPMYLSQSPGDGQFQNNYVTKGANSHRPGMKYDISQSKEGGLAVIGSVDFPVTENDPYTGLNSDPIYNLEMAYDIRNPVSAYGLNLGYRFRNPGETPPAAYFYPLQDQIIYSLGYVTALNTNHRYHVELFGALAADKEPHFKAKHVSALEGLVAYKQRLLKGLWGHIGATAEILPQGLAPQFRVYAGANWFFGFASTHANEMSASALSVLPGDVNLITNGEQKMDVSGGSAPYKYYLTRNFGRFDENQLTYYAPNKAGRTELVVEDSKGSKKIIPIVVAADTGPFRLAPEQLEMFEGEAKNISVDGGKEPITYRLSRPFGEFSDVDMMYQAPVESGEVELIAEDANGETRTATIIVKPVPKATREVVISNLQFKFNSDVLTKSSDQILESNIKKLKGEKIKKIIVIGHTDDIGKDAYNLKLSRQRAQAVATELAQRLGLDPSHVQAVGYGEKRPLATNKTDAGRQKNRRVELKLYY